MLSIKNIKQYRSYFKNEVRQASGRNENLISNYCIDPETGKKQFGWFDLYHGETGSLTDSPEEGIRKFLLGFLNIARDGQAVYEFLQNAVDAESTHFSMIWGTDKVDGKEYLLVANNGKMFTESNVSSILNIGASTKSNEEKGIGKFGIGFKLAHRLVGRGDGLDELIKGFSGPVLFSWKNGDIQKLAKLNDINLVDYQAGQVDETPWLFKILLTCFPSLPAYKQVKDEVLLFDGKTPDNSPFNQTEMEALSRWTKRLIDQNEGDTFQEGSLFFMELGEGKAEKLKDKNLNEGVQFSLGILDELSKQQKNKQLKSVQLNQDALIRLPELHYEQFSVSTTEEDYQSVFPNWKNAEHHLKSIDVLIGFKPYQEIKRFFKGAPNFYLYFPLSEEVHQFNFILHSNAFDNSSSRTFLQQGTGGEKGVNEKLFRVIVSRIGQRLKELTADDPKCFLDLYAAILSSGTSQNDNRKWIDAPFIHPLDRLLKAMIPVRQDFNDSSFSIATNDHKVYIKRTNIDIDTSAWGLNDLQWFYWDEKEYPDFKEKAIEKLGLRTYTIFELLKNKGIYEKLNTWIIEDPARIDLLLKELRPISTEEKDEAIIDNLKHLKLLHFDNGELYSFNELADIQDQGYLIMHRSLSTSRKLFQSLGFRVSQKSLEDHPIIEKMMSYQSNHSQLRNYTDLVNLFSDFVQSDQLNQLKIDEKYELFHCFRKLNKENVPQRMGELKLFRNRKREFVRLKNILKLSDRSWLIPFTILPEDHRDEISYLADSLDQIYPQIILPFWKQIAENIAEQEENERKQTLKEIIDFKEQAKSETKLSDQKLIFFQNRIIEAESIFYAEGLAEIPEENYFKAQHILHQHFNVIVPDQWFLPYLQEDTFQRDAAQLNWNCEVFRLEKRDLAALIQLLERSGKDFFQHLFIEEKESFIEVKPKEGKQNCYTSNPKLRNYLQSYYADHYQLISDDLAEELKLQTSLESEFLNVLMDDASASEADESQQTELTAALLSEGLGVQHNWFQKLKSISFDSEWQQEDANQVYLRFCKNLLDFYEAATDVSDKILLHSSEGIIQLRDFRQASDTLILKKDEKEYHLSHSKVLNEDHQGAMQQIHAFAEACFNRELITEKEKNSLFKLEQSEDLSIEEFDACLEDNRLENAHQMAFVLLSDDIEERTKYQILAANGEWYKLENNLLPPDCDYPHLINPEYRLAECYQGIDQLLHLNALEVFQYDKEEADILFLRFVFRSGCHSDVLALEDERQPTIEVLNYLYKSWRLSNRDAVASKENEEWEAVLGFNPALKVYHKLKVAAEQLPEDIEAWILEDEKRIDFIQSLGVQTPNSPLIQLRKSLVGDESEVSDELLVGLGIFQLNKTLSFLSQQKELQWQMEDLRLAIINFMQKKLSETNEPDIPVVVHLPNQQVQIVDPLISPVFRIQKDLHELLKEQQANQLEELYSTVSIVFEHPDLTAQNEFDLNLLPIQEDFQPQNADEHTEFFYPDWKEQNRLKLWRVKELPFELNVEQDDNSIALGRIIKPNWYFEEDDEGYGNFYYIYSRFGQLVYQLKELEHEKADALEELLDQKEEALRGVENSETLDRIIHEQGILKERRDFLKKLTESIKYSHDWFMAYLGYLGTFNEVDESKQQKSLAFQLAERHRDKTDGKISRKHFYLRGTGEMIPESIEHFEDFEISLRFRNRKVEKVRIEGVSKKGQDLLVYSREELSDELLKELPNVERAEIYFTPTLDLFKRLSQAFHQSDYIDSWVNIKESLPDLHFIYGPPGTGKTTTLSRQIVKALQSNHHERILILTPTNKAADVLAEKVLGEIDLLKAEKNAEIYSNVYRLGHATDPDLEENYTDLYQASIDEDLLKKANVVISTIHRLPYFSLAREEGSFKLIQLEQYWNQIIFDEASMINLTYMVFALKALEKSHANVAFFVAGDPKQIPPVESLSDKALEEMEIADENIYKMLEIEEFSEAHRGELLNDGKHTMKTLDKQYRSTEAIGKLYSQFAYNGLLSHHKKDNARELPEKFKQLFPQPISFIKFPLNNDQSIYKTEKLAYSPYHMHAAILAMEMIVEFDRQANEEGHSEEGKKWNIGLISPYKAHDVLTNKLITARYPLHCTHVHCSTVHGFQGDECDIIIFTATPNNNKYTGHPSALLSKEYLYNVAISRAKQNLWILHPDYQNSKNPYLQRLIGIAEENESCNHMRASSVEQALLGRTDFVESSSYFSGHDSINLYTKAEQHYFVKASASAIDIQLRDIQRF